MRRSAVGRRRADRLHQQRRGAESRAPRSPVDETSPLPPDEAIGAYKRSKIVAERVVEEMIARDRLPAVIVNPSTPIGPRDIKPTPTGRIMLDAARGRMPAFVDTGLNFVHVDDVAAGHLLAFEHGRIGERYILGGENVPLRELLAAIAGSSAGARRASALPRAPLYPLAFGAEAVARLTGKEPLLTRRWPAHGAATACSSPRPRPSASSAIAAGPIRRAWPMRSTGSGRRVT